MILFVAVFDDIEEQRKKVHYYPNNAQGSEDNISKSRSLIHFLLIALFDKITAVFSM
jgi:hypothetical protein